MALPVVRFGLLGCGTVGQGVVKMLRAEGPKVAREQGFSLELAGVAVRDLKKPRAVSLPRKLLRTASEIIKDRTIPIIVELIGGVDDAKHLVRAALNADPGKHVVTANKNLLATDAPYLFRRAAERGLLIQFEASVGGGIPIIAPLLRHFAGDTINAVTGIINGTTNSMLTAMHEGGIDFKAALAEAQRLGYAERDPTADVSGLDAGYKLAILASLAFGLPVTVDQICRRGIESVQSADFLEAKRRDFVIKLLAIARRVDGKIELRVEPVMIPHDTALAAIRGATNAVSVTGRFSGTQVFSGQGAGQMPTATSVMADLIAVARHCLSSTDRQWPPPLCWRNGTTATNAVLPVGAMRSRFYLRVGLEDRVGALHRVTKALMRASVNIALCEQGDAEKLRRGTPVPVVITTYKANRRNFLAALEEIKQLGCVLAPPAWLPIEPDI